MRVRFAPGRSRCFPRSSYAAVRITELYALCNQCRHPWAVFLLSNCRLPRDGKLLRIVVHADESRRGLKGVVQPHPQITIEEQLLPQQSGQS